MQEKLTKSIAIGIFLDIPRTSCVCVRARAVCRSHLPNLSAMTPAEKAPPQPPTRYMETVSAHMKLSSAGDGGAPNRSVIVSFRKALISCGRRDTGVIGPPHPPYRTTTPSLQDHHILLTGPPHPPYRTTTPSLQDHHTLLTGPPHPPNRTARPSPKQEQEQVQEHLRAQTRKRV